MSSASPIFFFFKKPKKKKGWVIVKDNDKVQPQMDSLESDQLKFKHYMITITFKTIEES